MAAQKQRKAKVYGKDARLQEIRRAINRPDLMDEVTVDMIYGILYNANGGM